ncbi:hypothetical protein [Bradyrhizobium sp. BR 1432]|uniref:hypothetical protein n=1 Tax=Bradyrhizobium sp. BR 1432 TaxID=3447966 RepID=UPI003EE6FD0E
MFFPETTQRSRRSTVIGKLEVEQQAESLAGQQPGEKVVALPSVAVMDAILVSPAAEVDVHQLVEFVPSLATPRAVAAKAVGWESAVDRNRGPACPYAHQFRHRAPGCALSEDTNHVAGQLGAKRRGFDAVAAAGVAGLRGCCGGLRHQKGSFGTGVCVVAVDGDDIIADRAQAQEIIGHKLPREVMQRETGTSRLLKKRTTFPV